MNALSFESLKRHKFYVFVILAGFILTLLWIIEADTRPFSDFQYYYDVALNVANGLPWGNTYTSVGYSIVLGGIFKIFGASLMAAKIFNIILALLNNILFLGILHKINLKDAGKKILFAMFVFFPNNIFYTSMVANELLFTSILLLITLIYFSSFKYKYVLIGVLTGVNTMIKPFFIVFFLLIFIVDFFIDKRLLYALKNSLIVILLCCIVISPWIYRNTKMIGQFTFVSNNGGIVMYINNNSQNKYGRWMAADDVENSIVKTEEYKNANMTQKNKMLSAAAKQWIKSHPKEFLQLGIKRLDNTFFTGDDVGYALNGTDFSDNAKSLFYNLTNNIRKIIFKPAVLCLALYSVIILKSIFTLRTDKLNRFNLYTTVLFYMFTSVYFLTEGQGRYAFPMIFIFIYYFCLLINYIYTKILIEWRK